MNESRISRTLSRDRYEAFLHGVGFFVKVDDPKQADCGEDGCKKERKRGLKWEEIEGSDKYPPESMANIQLSPVMITIIEKFFARVLSSGGQVCNGSQANA